MTLADFCFWYYFLIYKVQVKKILAFLAVFRILYSVFPIVLTCDLLKGQVHIFTAVMENMPQCSYQNCNATQTNGIICVCVSSSGLRRGCLWPHRPTTDTTYRLYSCLSRRTRYINTHTFTFLYERKSL